MIEVSGAAPKLTLELSAVLQSLASITAMVGSPPTAGDIGVRMGVNKGRDALRMLKELAGMGLVLSDKPKWRLTPAGRAALATLTKDDSDA